MSSLQGSFPKAAEADWRRVADRALKGKPSESLVSRSDDGLAIGPIYALRAAAEPLASRQGGRRWQVAERVDHPDPKMARELARLAVEGGADRLELVFSGSASTHGAGLPTDGDLGALLKDVALGETALHVDAGGASVDVSAALNLPRASAAFDPIATLAGKGMLVGALPNHYRQPSALLADSRPYHAAGASEAQELGIIAATLIEHWRGLEAAGASLPATADKVSVTLVADADELMTIAKLRAMRRLHARLLQASGFAATPLALHVETSWRMLTERDPYTNMLRSGVAAFGAAVGGADSITVLPFTARIGLADAFASRQARNAQLLLCEESNLHRVHDPAAGAGAFEETTEGLAAAAWRQMQAIEAEGGLVAALRSGSVQRALADSARQRAARLAAGERRLIGVNLAREAVPPKLQVAPFPPRPALAPVAAEEVEALVPAPFEDAFQAGESVA